jgi:hypothetical protein
MILNFLRRLLSGRAFLTGPKRTQPVVKPSLERLEDRITPSAFAHSAGGPDLDSGEAVARDQAGNVFVAGFFRDSIDFIGNSTATHFVANDYQDGFVAKYSANGNFLWARHLAGYGPYDSVWASSLAVGSHGQIYIAGGFSGGATFGYGFQTAPGTFNTFAAWLDTNGDWLGSTMFSGPDNLPYGIAVDSADDFYVTGGFTAGTVDFDPSPFLFTALTASEPSNYVVKVHPFTSEAVWAKKVTSPLGIANGLGTKHDIAVDSKDNVYTTSDFQGSADFGHGAVLTTGYDFNVYVSKRDSDGNMIWAHTLTSSPNVVTENALAVDKSGNVFITGWFEGNVDFDPGVPHQGDPDWLSDPQHSHDAFVAKLDASGNFAWDRRMGSPNSADEGHGIAVDGAGRVYVTGFFTNTADFGHQLVASQGDQDVFVAQLDKSGNMLLAIDQGGKGFDDAHDIALDPGFTVNDGLGYIDITGAFATTPGNPAHYGPALLTSAGANDVFVAKLSIPYSVTMGPKNTLQVLGNNAKNSIHFVDARGLLTVVMDGAEPLLFRDIEEIVARSGPGDDVINFECGDPNERVPDLWIDMGQGNDSFLFDAPNGVSDSNERGSRVHVNAGEGNDDVIFRFGSAIMANLDIDVRLGPGRDQFLLEALAGWQSPDGWRSRVRVLGGPGHDEFTIRLDRVSANVFFVLKRQGDHDDGLDILLDPRLR